MQFQFPMCSYSLTNPIVKCFTTKICSIMKKKKKLTNAHICLIFPVYLSAPLDVFSMFTLQIQKMPTRECCVKV